MDDLQIVSQGRNGGLQLKITRLKQALGDANRKIAELQGQLKERHAVAHELRDLVRELTAFDQLQKVRGE
jgi:hypothetical protein